MNDILKEFYRGNLSVDSSVGVQEPADLILAYISSISEKEHRVLK